MIAHTKDNIANNKLIAEFMGLKAMTLAEFEEYEGDDRDDVMWTDEQCKYLTSWDWLMPVIIKIADVSEYELASGYDYSYWNNAGKQAMGREFGGYGNGIEAIYEAVVEFIKWYNSQD